MKKLALAVLCTAFLAGAAGEQAVDYTSDGQLKFRADYRQWVFLSSGLGMTYGPLMAMDPKQPPQFDNVFVNPAAYRAFLKTGHWPDKTMFVLEVRGSESHASINRDGHFQTGIQGIEAEVKDHSAKAGEWTFYSFDGKGGIDTAASRPIPRAASCYSCHGANAAVENTFVQFYPELLEIAKQMGTVNASYHP